MLCKKLIPSLVRLWLKTLRVQWVSGFPPSPAIYGLWHEDLPACMAAFSHRQIAVMISSSEDGGHAASVALALGYQVFRGSSSRGQLALRHLLAPLRSGYSVGMALDGPRGPARVAKPGARWLADRSGATLIELQVTYGFHFRLGSWDQICIPLPFSTVRIQYRSPAG